jgi:hypothetical protein
MKRASRAAPLFDHGKDPPVVTTSSIAEQGAPGANGRRRPPTARVQRTARMVHRGFAAMLREL